MSQVVGCRLCLMNKAVRPIKENDHGYITEAMRGWGRVFHVTPRDHIGSEEELPSGWIDQVKDLYDSIPGIGKAIEVRMFFNPSNAGLGMRHIQLQVVLIFALAATTANALETEGS